MKKILKKIRKWKSPRLEPGGFYGNFETWEEALSLCGGYDDKEIFDKVSQSALKVKQGEAIFERDSVLFNHVEYSWPSLAALMNCAAQAKGKLRVLDFGGALGSTYFQNRSFFLGLEVEWSVVEQTHFVEFGQRKIADKKLNFYSSIKECLSEREPDVVFLSSVLQYLEEPYTVLSTLASLDVQSVIIDRTLFTNDNKDQIKIQLVPEGIYKASYPLRILNKKKVKSILIDHGFLLLEEFNSNIDPSGECYSSQGLIFTKRKATI